MGSVGGVNDESDIRTGRGREASPRPYPPRMDTPLWSQSRCTPDHSFADTNPRRRHMDALLKFVPFWAWQCPSSPARKTTLLFLWRSCVTFVSYQCAVTTYSNRLVRFLFLFLRWWVCTEAEGGCYPTQYGDFELDLALPWLRFPFFMGRPLKKNIIPSCHAVDADPVGIPALLFSSESVLLLLYIHVRNYICC